MDYSRAMINKKYNIKISGKLMIIALLVIGFILIFRQMGISDYFHLGNIRSFVNSLGIWAPLGFIGIYALFTSVGFPATPFTITGGIIFGKWLGTLLNLMGATIGACGAFWVARVLARKALEGRFKEKRWFIKFNRGLEESGLNYMLFVRLVPLFPFNGINFGSGLTRLSFRDFFLGTVIGMIPPTFIFTNVAYELGESAAEGFSFSPGLILAFILLGLFILIPVFYKRIRGSQTV